MPVSRADQVFSSFQTLLSKAIGLSSVPVGPFGISRVHDFGSDARSAGWLKSRSWKPTTEAPPPMTCAMSWRMPGDPHPLAQVERRHAEAGDRGLRRSTAAAALRSR